MCKDQNLCSTDGCGNKKAKNRTVCHKCKSIKYRADNPIMAAYANLRSNAKRRNKEFKISFEYFEKWCREENYIMGKGRTKTSYTIDRDKDELGYVEGNLKVLENADNVKKQRNREKMLKWAGLNERGESEFRFSEITERDNSDVPF